MAAYTGYATLKMSQIMHIKRFIRASDSDKQMVGTAETAAGLRREPFRYQISMMTLSDAQCSRESLT